MKEKIYIVNEGETLFSIAKKIYGNGFKYVDLAKDNNIQDPDIIVVGQKLTIYY
ncbi:MAG: LysM peptidoglycan-binding domain-containing protein [Bacteroidetes bacterium]|nr:LysM peptidoglycan-binding domain-containing protein [Bacteroidota bacterium]